MPSMDAPGAPVLSQSTAKLLDRWDRAKVSEIQELRLDDSNKVTFPGYPYTFEALNEQIICSIDVFKSGLECQVCKSTGRVKHVCECVTCDRPGKKYSASQIEEYSRSIGPQVAANRAAISCAECGGDPSSVAKDEVCAACKGAGATIILLDSSKSLPTTGVVVSMGRIAKEKADYKIGDRILWGEYTGGMIPTKAGLMFKRLDWNQALMKIEGAEALGAFDFILTKSINP